MKIAILSASDVSSWYAATLMERGHQIMFGPFGHVPTSVETMIKDEIDGVLILTDELCRAVDTELPEIRVAERNGVALHCADEPPKTETYQ